MRRFTTQPLVVALLFSCFSAIAQPPAPKALYEQHRWFDLREAIKSQEAPALYKGAVASAFNDSKDAEKYLGQVIEQAPNSKDAEEAHEILAYLYARSGMSQEAVLQYDAILRIKPGRQDVENVLPIFSAFCRYPDQSIGKFRRATVRGKISEKRDFDSSFDQ